MELTVPIVLLAGVVSFASPCFLPVVPVFVGYLTGQTSSIKTTARTSRDKRAGVFHSLAFMGAFSFVFITLWALVGLIGWAVGDYRAWLRIAGGVILVILGLHTAGLLQLSILDRVFQARYSPEKGAAPTYRRSVLLGLAFAAGWTPCIGPVLAGVLGLATNTPSLIQGVGLLAVYSLGLGLPFVLMCAGMTGITTRLSWFARHHRAVSVMSGALLIAIGFLMITNLLSRFAGILSVGL